MKGFIEVKRKDYKDYSCGKCIIKCGKASVAVNQITQVREPNVTIDERTGEIWSEEDLTGCEIHTTDEMVIRAEESYEEVMRLIEEARND